MQKFSELEKKPLDQHHVEYKAFARLLLSLAAGSLTLLAALLHETGSLNFASGLYFLFFLASIACGVVVQHQIMMAPRQHLQRAWQATATAEAQGRDEPLSIRKKAAFEIGLVPLQSSGVQFCSSFFVLDLLCIFRSLVSPTARCS